MVVGGIGSLLVTGASAVLFPALRRATDQLTAESLRAAEVRTGRGGAGGLRNPLQSRVL